jgi:hypothetical protein
MNFRLQRVNYAIRITDKFCGLEFFCIPNRDKDFNIQVHCPAAYHE